MKKILVIGFGVFSYLFFAAAFVYAIGFLSNAMVNKSIDRGVVHPGLGSLLVDFALLGLFAIQHSGMARRSFKSWEKKILPEPLQRSTFVLLASLSLALLFWQWRPLPALIWEVEAAWVRGLIWTMFAIGWVVVLASTFLISHTHMFGLKQVWAYFKGKDVPELGFQTRGLYRYVRHPLYLGMLIAFWATPAMTVGHLVFALAANGYILLGARLEERDLLLAFGKVYSQYSKRVSMLIPGLKGGIRQSD